MNSLKNILINELPLFQKSVFQLSEIYSDVKHIDLTQKEKTKEELYLLDTYSARFARTFDIFENKILKTIAAIFGYHYFTSLDLFRQSEKLDLITGSRAFYKMKQVRNRIVHEYAETDYLVIIEEAISYAPAILESYKNTRAYCDKIIKDNDLDF